MGGDREEVKDRWCKVCGKSFQCGRSLGGHMRSHLSLSSPAPMADERPAHSRRSCIDEFGIGYGLRKNPKKTWRLSQSAGDANKHEELCNDCGKGFPSLKSLFRHMRRHSEKPPCKLEEEDAEELKNEQGVEKKGPSPEKEPETELLVPRVKRKRSTRPTPTSDSSSSASEIDKEQEDVALTLMMLSRDTDFRSCINSVVEVPDLNSVVPGAKGTLNSQYRVQDGRNGLKRSEFDVSCAALMKLEAHVDDDDRMKHSLEEARNPSSMKCLIYSNDVMLPKGDTKLSSEQVCIVSDGDLHKALKKKDQYECSMCNKVFNSCQSLGGHRASHIRTKGCAGTRTGGNKKKIKNSVYCKGQKWQKLRSPTKKVNKLKCPI